MQIPTDPRRRVILLTLVLLALLVLAALFESISVERLRKTREWVNQTHRVDTRIARVLMNLTALESSARGYVMTGDEQHTTPRALLEKSVREDLNALRFLIVDQRQKQSLIELAGLVQVKLDWSNALIETRDQEGPINAMRLVESGRGRTMMDAARDMADRMVERQIELLGQRTRMAERAQIAFNTAFWMARLLELAIIVLVLAVVLRPKAETPLSAPEPVEPQPLPKEPVGLAEANRELQTLVVAAADEMQESLAAMEDPEQRETAVQELERTVGYLKDQAKISLRPLDPILLDVTELARSVARTVNEHSPDLQLDVTVADELKAYGDRSMLGLLLYTLLVDLALESREEVQKVQIGQVDNVDGTAFFVRSDDPGSDEPSESTGRSEHERRLALCRRIVLRHEGEFWMEHDPEFGRRALFTIGLSEG